MKELFDRYVSPEPTSGCWLWTGNAQKQGYGRFYTDDHKHVRLAHRVSYELHIGSIPEGMVICHKCDNTSCVNPDHLFVGTRADNNRDKCEKGRQSTKESHGKAKLTVADVKDIKSNKMSQRENAKKYGVRYQTIQAILSGKTWKNV